MRLFRIVGSARSAARRAVRAEPAETASRIKGLETARITPAAITVNRIGQGHHRVADRQPVNMSMIDEPQEGGKGGIVHEDRNRAGRLMGFLHGRRNLIGPA